VRGKLIEPSTEEVLAYCARDPVERVFLEDVARRGHGRFVAVQADAELSALCHLGTNAVPSGEGCGVFADHVVRAGTRMLIGEETAVTDLWRAAADRLPRPRDDRPAQPVYALGKLPVPGETGLREATLRDLDLLVPACAAAHLEELGVDPLDRDPEGFRWRTRTQIEEGRSWVWEERGVILFKAEASAWTPQAVQLQQVWVEPDLRGKGNGKRGLADLCRLLLETTPAVCLFVRPENAPAIALYESIGMQRTITYRSLIFG
jgi:uncharacterized protein